jgi:hypothetical protein
LNISENTGRPSVLFFHRPDAVIGNLMVFMTAVAEIQPEHVSPTFEQGLKHRAIPTGWADGCNNLGVALAAHMGSLAQKEWA